MANKEFKYSIYKIGEVKLQLIPYDDLKAKIEKKILKLLGLDKETIEELKEGKKKEVDVEADPFELLPLMLMPANAKHSVKKVDWGDVTPKIGTNIITDWVTMRCFFLVNTKDYVRDSLNKKMQPLLNMIRSTEKEEAHSNQK